MLGRDSYNCIQKVLEVDTREAQRLGLLRPLVRREIEKHFADFGLDPEFVSHNTMRGLSGGQKVKIVLGAATWRRPHIICLDEPTSMLNFAGHKMRELITASRLSRP